MEFECGNTNLRSPSFRSKKSLNHFIKSINDSIFTALRILKQNDTIYGIDRLDFWNVNGVDFDVRKKEEGFYGYSIRLLKDEYVVLGYYTDNGKNVADDVTLNYNADKKVFEIMIGP